MGRYKYAEEEHLFPRFIPPAAGPKPQSGAWLPQRHLVSVTPFAVPIHSLTYPHRNMMNQTSKDVKDVKFYERGGHVRDKKRFEENQVRSLPIQLS